MTPYKLKQIRSIIKRIAVRDGIALRTFCLETKNTLTLELLIAKIQYSLFWEYVELPVEEVDAEIELLYNEFLESPVEYQFKIIKPIAKIFL